MQIRQSINSQAHASCGPTYLFIGLEREIAFVVRRPFSLTTKVG